MANNVHILAIVFMLGNSYSDGVEETNRLQAEIDQFGDIIVGDFLDSYRNLTLKTIMAYEWLTSYCREAQIVVKTDDDVLVNVYQLTKELSSWSSADVLSSNIWCCVHKNESTIKDAKSIYYASPIDFPTGIFPIHCSGLGYVTPMRVIHRFAEEISRSFPRRVCTHEDVFMTAIVRGRINSIHNYFWQKYNQIELVNKSLPWRSLDLENGLGDKDYFLRNLTIGATNANETRNLIEFQKRHGTKIFYLIAHSDEFKDRYLRLWQIITKIYSTR